MDVDATDDGGDESAVEKRLEELLLRIDVVNFFPDTDDVTEEQVIWTKIGTCLHFQLVRMLRKYVQPVIKDLYETLKSSRGIDSQTKDDYLVEYPPPMYGNYTQTQDSYKLHYKNINNNNQFGKNKEKYVYSVTDAVELSKLFLPKPKETNYKDFETISLSSVLNLIINIGDFRHPLQLDVKKVRDKIRNRWAHPEEDTWNGDQLSKCFAKIQKCIGSLQLPEEEHSKILHQILCLRYCGEKTESKTGNTLKKIVRNLMEDEICSRISSGDSQRCKCRLRRDIVSQNQSDNNNLEANDTNPEKIKELWVSVIKLYSWLKDEMKRSHAVCVASQLLSPDDAEIIQNAKERLMAVDRLLKYVLCHETVYLCKFLRIADLHLKNALNTEMEKVRPNEKEIEDCERRNTQQIQDNNICSLAQGDRTSLLSKIKFMKTVDFLNNGFLGKFIFSLDEHDSVCEYLHRSDFIKGASSLIDTVERRSCTAMNLLCHLLEQRKATHSIVKELGLREKYCQARDMEPVTYRVVQVATQDGTEAQPQVVTTTGLPAGAQAVVQNPFNSTSPTPESQPDTRFTYLPAVSGGAGDVGTSHTEVTNALAGQAVRRETNDAENGVCAALQQKDDIDLNLDFKVVDIKTGSIEFRLHPQSTHSWKDLKRMCLSGDIVSMLNHTFLDKDVLKWLHIDEPRLLLTIYSDASLSSMDEAQRDAILKVNFISEESDSTESCGSEKNPLQTNVDILCEELEISDDLIKLLRIKELVPSDISLKLEETNSRALEIRCLLQNISFPDEGYKVIKEYLKYSNSYAYQALLQTENTSLQRKLTYKCEACLRRRADSGTQTSAKDIDIEALHEQTTGPIHRSWVITWSKCFFEQHEHGGEKNKPVNKATTTGEDLWFVENSEDSELESPGISEAKTSKAESAKLDKDKVKDPTRVFIEEKTGQPRKLSITCKDKIKESISHEVLSKYKQDWDESGQNLESLSWLCSVIKASSSNVIRVWIGYQAHGQQHPLFVAVVKQKDINLEKKIRAVLPFRIIQRQLDEVSEEAMLCLKIENRRRYSLNEHRKLHETILRHSDALMQSHSNLLIVSASPIKSREGGTHTEIKTCIVLYVHIKGIIPLQEKPFPSKVEEFPVDVREGVFKKYGLANLSFGNEICSAYGQAGRLGGFVRLSNGKLCCFTCFHLFDTDKSRADRARNEFNGAVYQTEQVSNPKPFGMLLGHNDDPGNKDRIGVDAALIEITDRLKAPADASFRIHSDSEPESDDQIEFSSGEVLSSPLEIVEILQSGHAKCKIVKYNERTKRMYMRTGILNTTGTTLNARWPTNSDEKCKLFSQIEIRPDLDEILDSDDKSFAKEGESGSLVFIMSDDLKNKNKWAVGMVVGGINASGAGIVTPIWAILDGFSLPRGLISFENQRLTRIELLLTSMNQKLDQALSNNQAR